MKQLVTIIFIIIALVILYVFYLRNAESAIIPVPSTTTSIKNTNDRSTQSVLISYKNIDYTLYYTNISGHEISVIPNFEDKVSASSIVSKNTCSAAINGGFYTEEGKPLGLFKVDDKIFEKEKTETNLVNGFFYLDNVNKPHVGSTYTDDALAIVQTGPYFSNNQHLSIKNDKQARRMVIFQTNENIYFAGALVFNDLSTSGPFLSDVPPILFSVEQPFSILKAINLDGGTASYYLGEDGFELSELTYIGSLLCIE